MQWSIVGMWAWWVLLYELWRKRTRRQNTPTLVRPKAGGRSQRCTDNENGSCRRAHANKLERPVSKRCCAVGFCRGKGSEAHVCFYQLYKLFSWSSVFEVIEHLRQYEHLETMLGYSTLYMTWLFWYECSRKASCLSEHVKPDTAYLEPIRARAFSGNRVSCQGRQHVTL